MRMSDRDPAWAREVICRCSGTTLGQVMRLMERGVTDLDGISRASGACSGCGACDTELLAFIRDHAVEGRPAPPTES